MHESDESFTLARLDIIETSTMSYHSKEEKVQLEVLAFIPSCLKLRVVPTHLAPNKAVVPKEYVEKIQHQVGKSRNFALDENGKTEEISRPLDIYEGDGMQDGIVEFNAINEMFHPKGRIRKDIVFASLGWIMLNHCGSFKVRPWCVKGSLWSKRGSLYPSNLEKRKDDFDTQVDEFSNVDINSLNEDNPLLHKIVERLRIAAESGRHQQYTGRGKSGRNFNEHTNDHRIKENNDDWWNTF